MFHNVYSANDICGFAYYTETKTVLVHNTLSELKPGFHQIVKSYDSSRFWLIVERLITIENKTLTEIGSDLQPKRFLS